MTDIRLELNEVKQGAFNLYIDGQKEGEMSVNIDSLNITVYHTEISPDYENMGYARQLLDTMVGYAREHRLEVNPLCPYVSAQFRRHPEQYADVWQPATR